MKIKRILAGALACCTAGMLLPVHVFAEEAENQQEVFGIVDLAIDSPEIVHNVDGMEVLTPNYTEENVRFTKNGLYTVSFDAGQPVHGMNGLSLTLNNQFIYNGLDGEHIDFSDIDYHPSIIVRQIKIDDVPQPMIGYIDLIPSAPMGYGWLAMYHSDYGTLSPRLTSFDEWKKIEVTFSVLGISDNIEPDDPRIGDLTRFPNEEQYGVMFLDLDHPNELTPENPEIEQSEYERRTDRYIDAYVLPDGWSDQVVRFNSDGTYTVSIEASEPMHGMNDIYICLTGDLVYYDDYTPTITIIDTAIDGEHSEQNLVFDVLPDNGNIEGNGWRHFHADCREDTDFDTWQKYEVTFTVSGMREAEPVITTTTPETTTTTETTATAPAAPAPAQPAANNSSAGNTAASNNTTSSSTNSTSNAPKTGDSGTGLAVALLMLSGTAALLAKKKH